jgi:hypothetical protein
VAEDAGASFLIIGLFLLSVSVFALGLSRSSISFVITRGVSGERFPLSPLGRR